MYCKLKSEILLFFPRYILHDNGTLTVSRLDLDHAGVYQCFIRNEAGETSKSTWLRVNSAPPTFVQRPVDITVIETEDAKFQCETRGAPKPVVSWSRGNYRNDPKFLGQIGLDKQCRPRSDQGLHCLLFHLYRLFDKIP